ncbi:RPS22, partial [Symbiodinium pilosum]
EQTSELLAFHCTGKSCGHHWVTGRGTTSTEQICKCCGESVVGVPSKGSVFCEVDKEGAGDDGEVVKIRLEQHVAPGWATLELEDRLLDFVRSEIKFISQFFQEDGVQDYVAYRSGKRLEGAEGRDRNKDALLIHRAARVVDALCRAEFTGTLRAGEADAKLQAFLKGRIQFSLT